ncbi:hypothetical protein QIS99_30390 [Streptomyces sp. B-S-A8]|uniref:Uncharacterized protein n=1 Tax=Streptomyces solicavernae TaxID=3043614 RepID=A0ABT6S1A0_9ACTN|nr:hypothetical protein [Streptomyces sp. B-S-A8]MDI3390470.1 hypothetical protein [Streptomyces sp. B-S-A8]
MADTPNWPVPARPLTADEEAKSIQMIADLISANTPDATHVRDTTPVPDHGDAVPIAQPGRPPMSQRATDHASLVLAYSVGSLPVGAAFSLLLWSLSNVPTETLVIAAVAPVSLVATVGLAARMIGRAVRDSADALPDHTEHHHHGPSYITHNELHTNTRWFGTTNNQLGND